MECNKDEALKAKELAEKKLREKDFTAAKILATKARDLDPSIDGITRFLATIEVYISSENMVNGEVDWYSILGVQPTADVQTIRRRYRKLALTLHPDKNKSEGADHAFDFITQAWSLLSDQGKRMAYDQRRNSSGTHQATPGGTPFVPVYQNGFFNSFNTAYWMGSNQSQRNPTRPHHTTTVSMNGTFWTMCRSCRTKFEYSARYANCTLVCVSCNQSFLAFETSPPPVYRNASSTSSSSQMNQNNINSTRMEANNHAPGRTPMSAANSTLGSGPSFIPRGPSNVTTSYSTAANSSLGSGPSFIPRGPSGATTSYSTAANSSLGSGPSFIPRGPSGATTSYSTAANSSLGSGPSSIPRGPSSATTSYSTAAEAPGSVRISPNTIKRPREESTPLGSAPQSSHFGSNSVLREDMPRKKSCTEERRYVRTETASQNEGRCSANGFGAQKDSSDAGRTSASGNCRRYGIREVSQLQMKKILIEKAQKDIRKKLPELNVSSKPRNSDKPKKTDTDVREVREKDKKKPINGVKPGAQEFVDSDTIDKKCFSADSEVTDSISMSVPDPDFHDFDGDRIENAFGENQVWAVYDEDDGMPRYYAMMHSVVSKSPFRMTISWLNSKTNNELGPIKWVSSGFTKTTGDFRAGKRGLFGSLNSFSHRVQWEKGLRGAVHIFPKKGEVWAVFRNWSLDWDQFTDEKVVHQYDMVEVFDDYNEEKGVNVNPLVKVAGFKTVFCRNSDPRKIRNIPKAELFRLSHQVPSYLLTGEEGHNAPKGCLELDPAAMPMELLQVLTEEQEPVMWNIKNFREDGSVEGSKAKKKEDSAEDVPTKEVAEAMGSKESKPEILYVYKRRRLREKKAL